ncbi:hypothetical protein [Candidatus Nucleicultrix amoebiphila]|jgi:hypothetical protein|uniref:hypothetical protein n=1 Tax=Candidatus Nucleicultrix amoebiphila TaxID=1509244 RepID=UPI000A2709BB|nr:hypothetical protein [Candidatus Nucleicultrix amoebiphila]
MKKLNKFEQRLLLGIATSVLITSVGFATPQKSLEARGIHTDASTAAKIVKSPELLKEVTEQAKPSGVDIKAYVETKEKAAKGTAPAAIVAAVKASGGAVANPAIVHLTGLPGAPGNAANPAPTAKQIALAVKLFALNPAFDFPDFEAAQDLVKGDAASGRAKIAVVALTLANVTAAKHIRTAAGLLAALPNAGHFTTQELEATDNLLRGVNGAAQDLNPNAPAIAGELVRIAALGHVGAPRLGVLGVGLTPENLVTGDLLHPLKNAFMLPEFNAAYYLLHGAAPGHATVGAVIGAPNLDQILATEYLQTNAGGLGHAVIAAPNADRVNATVYLQRNGAGLAAAPVLAPTLAQIDAFIRLGVGGVHTLAAIDNEVLAHGHVGAPRLGVLGVGLTPENLATGDLLHPLKNAFTLPEFNAAYYLLHGAAPGNPTVGAVIGAPNLDQIEATEYLQTNPANGLAHAAVAAPTANQVDATVYLQKDRGGHLGAPAVPAPTLARIDALVGLGVGGVHTLAAIDIAVGGGGGGGVHPGAAQLAVLGIGGPTAEQTLAADHLHALGGGTWTGFSRARLDAAVELMSGAGALPAPSKDQIRAVQEATVDGNAQGGTAAGIGTAVAWAIKNGFGAQPVGTIPRAAAVYDTKNVGDREFVIRWPVNVGALGLTAQARLFAGGIGGIGTQNRFKVRDTQIGGLAAVLPAVPVVEKIVVFSNLTNGSQAGKVKMTDGAVAP